MLGVMLVPLAGCSSMVARGQNAEGVRLSQQAQYDAAMQRFREATYTDPNDADAYYNIAATYHRTGLIENSQADLDQAESYYRLCRDHNPNHSDCYRGLAVLLAQRGRKDEAFQLLESWVEHEPTQPDARIELARLCDEFGNRAEAKEHLVEALNVDPNSPRALAALGKIREDGGDHAQALRNYQLSLRGKYQPQVASRVAALQTAPPVRSQPLMLPDDGTQIADRSNTTLR
ncbi:MAG TPA: tetratricopeptide repeat protein [Thermoguttaceae bacterium]|nr:tetratricopeptide repeat protein [Thermoguttaceae bacterium]